MSQQLSNSTRVMRALVARALTDSTDDARSFIDHHFGWDASLTKSALGGYTGNDIGISSSATAEFLREVAFTGIFGAMRRHMWETEFNEPFSTALALSAHWVAERRPIPITKSALTSSSLSHLKLASLSVMSKAVLRNEKFAPALQRAQATTMRHDLDGAFIDPGNTGLAGETPASVTSTPGVVSIAATSDPVADIKTLGQNFQNLPSSFFITDAQTAMSLPSEHFPDSGILGGSIKGIPLLVSDSSPRDSSGGNLVLLDASRVVFALGELVFTTSDDADIEMFDEIDSDGSGEVVGLFQTEAVAIKAIQYCNWQLLDAAGCRILTACDW